MQQLRDELCAISAPLARVHLQFGRLSALRVPRESAIELIEAIAMLANRVSLLLGLETACALSALRVTMRLLIRQGFLPARRAVLVCTLRPPGTRLAQGEVEALFDPDVFSIFGSVIGILCVFRLNLASIARAFDRMLRT